MPTVIIYHNPRCSKSRQTLELLREHNITPTIIEYLDTPLDTMTLKKIAKLLALSPRELMRKGEPIYKELQLSNPKLSDEELFVAMSKNPILIERPIVLVGNKAIIGRPPENVLEII